MTTYYLTRPDRLALDDFARLADLHPELARRFVTLGLLEATTDASGALWFRRGQLTRLARIRRLRAGFALNYAALGLVLDLLDRIAVLEAQHRRDIRGEATRWT
ncbi:hypothetical protein E0H73_41810 [Kribbella pittospori]|uniref:MerR family transcriptional regulator n=1 Tax=Kribbella pittospori TaxID=722689 RepID=A0A4R0JUQ1_9ACTN|nr:chaperone modulator CbpM [Kribbella pittospori]TCC50370.1 hypothetical protein E0H73_41810 [Kribbella pittospori]